METKHITHVILYAKNFYVHTGNVVKDMQRFMQLDGHKYKSINTPEKVYAAMENDFIKFINSVEDPHDKEYFNSGVGQSVAWADGVEGKIWHILIIYEGNHIPMNAKNIGGYPIYDRYHLPQRTVTDLNFSSCKSHEEMMKMAKDFLDITQEDDMDAYMNKALKEFNYDEMVKIYKGIGKDISSEELKDEIWDAYTDYMDRNLNDDGTISNNDYFFTKHFFLGFNVKNGYVSVDINGIFGKLSYSCDESNDIIAKHKLFDMAIADTEGRNKFINIAAIANSINNDAFYEYSSTFDGQGESFASMKTDSFLTIKKPGHDTVSTGGHCYTLSRNGNTVTLDIHLEHLFACAVKEGHLHNINMWCNASKW